MIYRPRATTAPAPVLLYVHGGGWVGGSEYDAAADLRRLADEGRVVVSVGYTLASDTLPTWDVAGPQVACALATVGARAGALGGDPSRITVAGDSAGGQLAVSVGYAAAAGRASSSCGGAVPRPAGIVVQYPAVDILDAYAHGRLPLSRGDARDLGIRYLGGTPEQVPARYRAILGTSVITPAAPPTLVISPTRDVLVPPEGVEGFVDAARAAGVDATLVRMPFANHAYDMIEPGSLGDQAKTTIGGAWLAQHRL